jgi:hypothetical protein
MSRSDLGIIDQELDVDKHPDEFHQKTILMRFLQNDNVSNILLLDGKEKGKEKGDDQMKMGFRMMASPTNIPIAISLPSSSPTLSSLPTKGSQNKEEKQKSDAKDKDKGGSSSVQGDQGKMSPKCNDGTCKPAPSSLTLFPYHSRGECRCSDDCSCCINSGTRCEAHSKPYNGRNCGDRGAYYQPISIY